MPRYTSGSYAEFQRRSADCGALFLFGGVMPRPRLSKAMTRRKRAIYAEIVKEHEQQKAVDEAKRLGKV